MSRQKTRTKRVRTAVDHRYRKTDAVIHERNGSGHKRLPVTTQPSAQANDSTQPTPEGTLIPPMRVGRLRTVYDWHRQVAKIYRAMRKGYLPKEDATKLTWVAKIGAELARYMQELKEIEDIRQQLKVLQAGTPLLLPPEDTTP